MFRYRFITPHRIGKWYPDLETAQRFACDIGAGFLDGLSGEFYAYRDTRLEREPIETETAQAA
jgi:hypothetical protein